MLKDASASTQAQDYFVKGHSAAENNDYDTAIEAYLQGLRLNPDAVEAHAALRKVALHRRAQGGETLTELDIAAHSQGRAPLDKMLDAEYILSRQPSHLPSAEGLLRAAIAGGYHKTARWMADLLFLANKKCKRPSVETYLFLKDTYLKIGVHSRAILACQHALKIKPKDRDLVKQLRELTNAQNARIEAETSNALDTQDHLLELSLESTEKDAADTASLQPDSGPERHKAVISETGRDAASLFFAKAAKAAEGGSIDYAIDMYMQGLRHDPEALEEGHLPLCKLGLQRQSKGGKKPSMVDRARGLRSKTALDQLLNAEYLFVKDPSHLPYAEAMLRAAVAGQYFKVADWIANLIFQTNNMADRPSFQTYILLKDSYAALGQYDKSLAACQKAMKLRPDKDELSEDFKNLSAELTMARGKYDKEGDFRKAIKDRKKQEYLYTQDRVVKTQDWRVLAVYEARKALEGNPDLPKNIYNLAAALSDLETDEGDAEAVKLLQEAYEAQANFSFQEKAGRLRIKHIKRKIHQALNALENDPEDAQVQAQIAQAQEQLQKLELAHYQDCVKNYPTDRRFKYELAQRLAQGERYDEAIPLFQEARKDPARKLQSMNHIGLCFFHKGWMSDAIDVFSQALDGHETKDDYMGKEIRYNLARAYESQGSNENALDIYRKIAQSDFSYRDVHERVEKLRQEEAQS